MIKSGLATWSSLSSRTLAGATQHMVRAASRSHAKGIVRIYRNLERDARRACGIVGPCMILSPPSHAGCDRGSRTPGLAPPDRDHLESAPTDNAAPAEGRSKHYAYVYRNLTHITDSVISPMLAV